MAWSDIARRMAMMARRLRKSGSQKSLLGSSGRRPRPGHDLPPRGRVVGGGRRPLFPDQELPSEEPSSDRGLLQRGRRR